MTDEKLTHKQKKYVDGYIEHGNGSKAARDAGYSAKTARQMSTENLAKPAINNTIKKYMTEAAKNVNLTREFVLEELIEWAKKREKGCSIRALELLGKHLRMFGEEVNVSIKTHEQALAELEEMMKDE